MAVQALIADDHPLFRAALSQALSGVLHGDIRQAEDLPQTLQTLEQHPETELLFLDINMPGNNGLAGLAMLRNRFADVLVVMVSAEENPRIIRQAIQLGASGYIPKSASLELISEAVCQVMDGEIWLPDGLNGGEPEHDTQLQQFAQHLQQLTPQQFSVLQLLADGLLNKQIADRLNVQETTIKQHVSAILRKLKVLNRTQAGVLFKRLMAE